MQVERDDPPVGEVPPDEAQQVHAAARREGGADQPLFDRLAINSAGAALTQLVDQMHDLRDIPRDLLAIL